MGFTRNEIVMIVERIVADLSTIRYVVGSQRCCIPYQRTCKSNQRPKKKDEREKKRE